MPGPGCCSSVQQLRAAMPPTTARSPARAAAQRAAAAGRSAEGRSSSFAAAARSPCPPAAADLPGPVMRITGVMRGRERPAIAAQLRITEATLYAELGPGTGPLPVSFRTPWPLPAAAADPLRCRSAACEGSAASSREPVRQQPTGVMERGQRRGPLSECVPGLHGGRAAGDDRAETPWLLPRGGCAWVGCRGSQCQRRGCRNSEGVAAPGALAGAAALCIAAAVLARAALRLREHLPDGAAAGGLLLLSGSAARAFAAAARGTGAAPTGWRSSSQLPPPHRVSGGGAGGGVPFSRVRGQE